jgi:GT2 family glycosyltransferase
MRLIAKRGYDFHCICPENGYTIAENRNYIAVQALNNNSDYLLMIDDDMVFEPDLLDKLIANKKDICGVAYHPRTDMQGRLKFLDETHYINLETNKDPKYKNTFECHATGTGIILIKCEVFKKIPRPWFMFEYYDKPTDLNAGQCKLGEDWFFCREAKKAGFKIWTDPKIKVNHIGEEIY